MRLIELEIHNIRGICDLKLNFNCNNLVIWGCNGSGKSAVVDAIDFLLTGKISRLTGKGSGELKLETHGTHITHKPEQAMVRAVISFPNYKKPIEIKRCMLSPGRLEYTDPDAKTYLEPVLSVASRGQYVLTRREILKYITSEPGNRAQEIQLLLNISEIEKIRQAFVQVTNLCKKEYELENKALNVVNGEITSIVNIKSFEVEPILKWVNSKRVLLNATPITELKFSELKINVIAPVFQVGESVINISDFKTHMDNLNRFIKEENLNALLKTDEELRENLQLIQSNPNLLQLLKKLRLYQLGIELIDETGACPLCDKPWEPGTLQKYLDTNLRTAKIAQEHQNNINIKVKIFTDTLSNVLASIKRVINIAGVVGLKEEKLRLETWRDNIDTLLEMLVNPVDNYQVSEYTVSKLRMMLVSPEFELVLKHISNVFASSFSKTTPQQEAWDMLTQMEVRLSTLEKTKKQLINKKLIYRRSIILHDTYISARDSILKTIYNSVRDRFVELYRQIHSTDESKFTAEIEPDEAGLDFTVDFYGYGNHPPHAMHSEGHQDSMGLCLYLALTEKLTKGVIDLIILDDVVMSVDTDHRKQICELLSTAFPNNQFIITTHDRTWANQLRGANIVDSTGMIQFFNWHVDTGPQIDFQGDVWGKIDNDLIKDDVSSASGRLRQNAEQFFALVCDSLQAPVVYKINGSYDFGNLLDGAIGQYKKLISKAKNVAQSWGKEDEFHKLQEYDSIVQAIYKRTNAEKWPINATIHYNNWANLSKPDFQPVVDAFKDLYEVFVCTKCSKLLHLVTVNGRQESVRCDCSQVNWNLVPKEK